MFEWRSRVRPRAGRKLRFARGSIDTLERSGDRVVPLEGRPGRSQACFADRVHGPRWLSLARVLLGRYLDPLSDDYYPDWGTHNLGPRQYDN
jgi:hypothetical protein